MFKKFRVSIRTEWNDKKLTTFVFEYGVVGEANRVARSISTGWEHVHSDWKLYNWSPGLNRVSPALHLQLCQSTAITYC